MISRTDAEKIAELIIKGLEKYAGKSSAAASAAASEKKYEEVKGRGGSLDKDPINKGGTIANAVVFRKNVEQASKHFSMSMGQTSIEFAKKIFHPFRSLKESKMRTILGGTEDIAAQLSGLQQELAQSLIDYVKDTGTDLSNFTKGTDQLNAFSESLFNITKDEEIAAGALNDVIDGLKNFEDSAGNVHNIFESLPQHIQNTINTINTEGMHRSKLNKDDEKAVKLYNEKKEALRELTGVINESADTIVQVGNEMAHNIDRMSQEVKKNIFFYGKMAASATAVSVFQYVEDSIFRFQSALGDTYNMAALALGTSHRQIQEGIIQYKDVLRMDSLQTGQGMYTSGTEEAIKHIANLGERFNLIGTEAFQFGMQLRESARLTGLSANLNEKSMLSFYDKMSTSLNMTIMEFGDFFNSLAHDSSFVSFANSMSIYGNRAQDALEEEITRRARMNKILGLSNDALRERLALENAKRWAPITEKYRSRIGASMLIGKYEEFLGVSLDKQQKSILSQYMMAPQSLDAEQSKIFESTIRPLLTLGPELVQQKINEMIKAAPESQKDALTQQLSVFQHLIGTFGGMGGELAFPVGQSAQALAQFNNIAQEYGKSQEDTLKDMVSGVAQIPGSELSDLFKVVSGESEATNEELLKANEKLGKGLEIYSDIRELLQGMALSVPGKLLAAAGSIGGGLLKSAFDAYFLRGVLTGSWGMGMKGAGSALGRGAVSALSLGAIPVAQTMGAKFVSMVGGAALWGPLFYQMGTWAGNAMYEAWKDKDWFIDFADSAFSRAEAYVKNLNPFSDEPAQIGYRENSIADKVDKFFSNLFSKEPSTEIVEKNTPDEVQIPSQSTETPKNYRDRDIEDREAQASVLDSILDSQQMGQEETLAQMLKHLKRLVEVAEKGDRDAEVVAEENRQYKLNLAESLEDIRGSGSLALRQANEQLGRMQGMTLITSGV